MRAFANAQALEYLEKRERIVKERIMTGVAGSKLAVERRAIS